MLSIKALTVLRTPDDECAAAADGICCNCCAVAQHCSWARVLQGSRGLMKHRGRCCKRGSGGTHLLLLVFWAAAQQLSSSTAQQQPLGSVVASAQLLPAPIQLVPDFYDDDPTAPCSTSNIVASTVDSLLALQQADAPRTVVVQTSLAVTQLLEATIFSTAGLRVVLFKSSGG